MKPTYGPGGWSDGKGYPTGYESFPHRTTGVKCPETRAETDPDVALRERLFAAGRDWWLLKPTVRSVRLALYVMARLHARP